MCQEFLTYGSCEEGAANLSSIDNSHVHALSTGVVQKGRVEGPADGLIPPERECNVRNPAADLTPWADPLDLSAGLKEVNGVVVVLGHACADGQDVGVKNDVLGIEAHLLHQDPESSLTDADLPRIFSAQRVLRLRTAST